ncbi:hypothetical protein [Aliagarivorans taiwanensis]|uniref:hypothetical protein n=1 Tax=Aliagarivorans taiwanensis TaxID=561966 RepID=UPI0004079F49|nr:hypothetical protein [Aliagarivorans taiwanensis]
MYVIAKLNNEICKPHGISLGIAALIEAIGQEGADYPTLMVRTSASKQWLVDKVKYHEDLFARRQLTKAELQRRGLNQHKASLVTLSRKGRRILAAIQKANASLGGHGSFESTALTLVNEALVSQQVIRGQAEQNQNYAQALKCEGALESLNTLKESLCG